MPIRAKWRKALQVPSGANKQISLDQGYRYSAQLSRVVDWSIPSYPMAMFGEYAGHCLIRLYNIGIARVLQR